jgi:hypothetical protein
LTYRTASVQPWAPKKHQTKSCRVILMKLLMVARLVERFHALVWRRRVKLVTRQRPAASGPTIGDRGRVRTARQREFLEDFANAGKVPVGNQPSVEV